MLLICFLSLAGLPRSRPKDFSVSRDFRKADRAVRHARGTSASFAGGGRESLCLDFGFISLASVSFIIHFQHSQSVGTRCATGF